MRAQSECDLRQPANDREQGNQRRRGAARPHLETTARSGHVNLGRFERVFRRELCAGRRVIFRLPSQNQRAVKLTTILPWYTPPVRMRRCWKSSAHTSIVGSTSYETRGKQRWVPPPSSSFCAFRRRLAGRASYVLTFKVTSRPSDGEMPLKQVVLNDERDGRARTNQSRPYMYSDSGSRMRYL